MLGRGFAYLDELSIKFQALFLVDQEFLNIFALVALKLDHLTHLRITDDGAIAGCRVSVRQGASDEDYESFKVY